jgi:hypothetical protein
MSSFKQLNKSDITTVPYAANKRWSFDDSGILDSRFSVYKGTYITGTFVPSKESTFNGQYRRLIFDSINHLFYQSYSGSLLDTGSLMFNVTTYESASQQRPTSSYFDYNINPNLIKNFPTGSGAEITVVAINPQVYGSKVLPDSFKIESGSVVKIIDDGYGNLFDIAGIESNYVFPSWGNGYFFTPPLGATEATHVGNIFYAHGIVVITNSNYQDVFEDIEYLSTETEIPEPIITETNNNYLIE